MNIYKLGVHLRKVIGKELSENLSMDASDSIEVDYKYDESQIGHGKFEFSITVKPRFGPEEMKKTVGEDEDLDLLVISAIENGVEAVAEKLHLQSERASSEVETDLMLYLADTLEDSIGWDWYSGMSLFETGRRPLTYNYIKYSVEADLELGDHK